MLIGFIYSIVIFLACVLGAIVGLGGGVFIRPVFDAIGHHQILDIAFLTSVAIVSMSIVSTTKKIIDGHLSVEIKMAALVSIGAITGGMIGNLILEFMEYTLYYQATASLIQTISTIVVLIFAIFAATRRDLRCEIKSSIMMIIIGIGLGTVSTFLGIGGGPINVPILMIFFGLPIKTATGYSIVIIFFSHVSRLVTMGITQGGYSGFDLPILPFIIIAAALGGFLGAYFSKIFSDNVVKKLFIAALLAVMVLNIYNAVVIILDKLG